MPVAKGGTKQVPMCPDCHAIIHGHAVAHGKAIKKSLAIAKENGVVLGAPKKLTGHIVSEVHRLRSEDIPFKSIAKELGISVGSVYNALQ